MRAGGEEVASARVAQSVERSAVNRKVGGSNPPVSDIFLFTDDIKELDQMNGRPIFFLP